MSQLTSIIAVNSYKPKKINRYDVDGGCIVQGTNGSGKTSLLRLSLLFFGVQPREIALIAGKNNRFSDYYLNSDSSYVVFEYLKSDQPRLVIAYAKPNGEVAYRFYDGAFEESLFIDGRGQFISNKDLKAHIQTLTGKRLLREFSWAQYKEIIQSGVRRPLNTPDAREINEAKLSFSLCEPNKIIGDIDRVMVSIVSSKPSFQSVKALIARNLVAADQFHEPIYRTGMFDSKQWELQRTLLDQSRRLMKQRSELTQMQTADAIIENIDEQLAMVKADASFTLASHQQTMATASEQAQQLKQQLDGLSNQFKQSQFALQTSLSQLKADAAEKKRRVDQLEATKQQYQQRDIHQQQMMAKMLPSLLEQRVSQESVLNEIEHNFADISRIYKEQASALEISHLNQLSGLAEEKQRQLNEVLSQKEALRTQAEQQREALEQQSEAVLTRLNESMTQQASEISRLQERLNHPNNEQIASIQDQLHSQQQQLSEQKTALNRVSGERFDLQQKIQSLTSQRIQLLNKHDEAKRLQQALESQRTEHQQSLKHVENMFFMKLTELSPRHADLASRCLRKEVLTQPMLEPIALIEDDFKVLGCEIDVSRIPAMEILDKQQLEAALVKLAAELDQCLANQADLSHQLVDIEKKLSQLNDSSTKYEVEDKKLRYALEQSETSLLKLTNQLAIEQQKQQQAIKVELETLKRLMSETKAAIQAQQSQKAQAKRDIQQDLDSKLAQLHAYQGQIEDSFNQQQQTLSQQYAQTLADIQRNQEAALGQAGADIQALTSQKALLAQINNAITDAQQAQTLVSEYQRWLDQHYSAYESLKQEQAQLLEQITAQQTQLDQRTQDFHLQETSLTKEIDRLTKLLSQSQQEAQIIQGLLNHQLDSVSSNKGSKKPSLVSAHQLQQQVTELVSQRSVQFGQGREACSKILTSLKQTKELEQKVSEALESQGLNDLGAVAQWRSYLSSLSFLLGDYLQGLAEGIRQQYALLSQQLIDLNSYLDDQSNRIKEKGRRISNKMNEMATTFAQVERIQAHISSNIEQIGFKRSLSLAAKQAIDIIRMPAHESIPESYFDSVSQAIMDMERYGKNLDLEQFIDIVIEVKNKGQSIARKAHDDKSLNNIDSEGLSFLILLSLYMAIKNTMQQDDQVTLLWAIDELGKLHHDNIGALMELLKRERVDFLCAEPHTNAKVLSLFQHIYYIQESGKVKKMNGLKQQLPSDIIRRVIAQQQELDHE